MQLETACSAITHLNFGEVRKFWMFRERQRETTGEEVRENNREEKQARGKQSVEEEGEWLVCFCDGHLETM